MKICERCGTEVFDDETFCRRCGYDGIMLNFSDSYARPKKNDRMIAIMLAILPGLVNVFGLGQLYLKRYIRAGIFITLTIIMYVASFYLDDSWQTAFTIAIMSLFVIQSVDVFMLTSDRNL